MSQSAPAWETPPLCAIRKFKSREIEGAGSAGFTLMKAHTLACVHSAALRFEGSSRLQEEKARRDAIVAVELHVIIRRRDPIPPWHRCRLGPTHVRQSHNHDIPAPHGTAHQHNFQLDRGVQRDLFGAKEINTGRADVPCDQRNRKVFPDPIDAPQTERQTQARAGIFSMLGKNADGMRRNPHESPWRLRPEQRQHFERGRFNCWSSQQAPCFLGSRGNTSLRVRLVLPQQVQLWCAVGRAHLALREASTTHPITGPSRAFERIPSPRICGAGN